MGYLLWRALHDYCTTLTSMDAWLRSPAAVNPPVKLPSPALAHRSRTAAPPLGDGSPSCSQVHVTSITPPPVQQQRRDAPIRQRLCPALPALGRGRRNADALHPQRVLVHANDFWGGEDLQRGGVNARHEVIRNEQGRRHHRPSGKV